MVASREWCSTAQYPEMSGVPQGSIQELVLFSILIDDIMVLSAPSANLQMTPS